MSSTFRVTATQLHHATWMPRSNIFRWVTLQIAEVLDNEKLAQRFYSASENPTAYFDITEFSAKSFNEVFHAVGLVETKINFISPDPEYVYYLSAINFLKVIMYLDNRCELLNHYRLEGVIRITEDTAWETKGWIYDLVLVVVQVYSMQADNLQFATQVQQARRSGVMDWSALQGKELDIVINTMDSIHQTSIGQIVGSTHFDNELKPACKTLYKKFESHYGDAIKDWDERQIQEILKRSKEKK